MLKNRRRAIKFPFLQFFRSYFDVACCFSGVFFLRITSSSFFVKYWGLMSCSSSLNSLGGSSLISLDSWSVPTISEVFFSQLAACSYTLDIHWWLLFFLSFLWFWFYIIITPLRTFHTSVSWWFFIGVWETANPPKSSGPFSVSWPILMML